MSGDITLFQDADLEYSPEEYPGLIAPIVSGEADVVYGSRFLGSPRRVVFFRHALGNKLLTLLSNLCTDLNLTDMETCYKVFRTDVLRRCRLASDRFGIEPEVTAKVAQLGCRVYEVPISYHGREYWEGKKIGWRDGFAAVWTIFKYALVHEVDRSNEGDNALQRLRRTPRYDQWVWGCLTPFVGDHVLEVGSGVGSVTAFLRNRERVVATDKNEQYLAVLRNRFAGYDNIEVRGVDWERGGLDGIGARRFDTVLCLNALEYIKDDVATLATFAELLEPGGRLVLQVPGMRGLYGEIDRAIGYHRRYDQTDLTAKLAAQNLEVSEAFYFNTPGVLGWYVNSVLLRRRTVAGPRVRFANLLVPWLRLEQRLRPRWGLALVAVARKKA